MTPQASQLFIVATFALLVGVLVGVYATRTVYGDSVAPLDPSPAEVPVCPKCPICPSCPPPPPCNDLSLVPSSPDEEPSEVDPIVKAPAGPGLPASALRTASEATLSAVRACLEDRELVGEERGLILLQLSVTATGGEGRVREALVVQRSGVDSRDLEFCLEQAARRARFPQTEDGSGQVKLPIRIGK